MSVRDTKPLSDWNRILRELRQERGLSQRRASLGAGINRTTLRRYEGFFGASGRDVCIIERLLRFYGYELEAIRRPEEGEAG